MGVLKLNKLVSLYCLAMPPLLLGPRWGQVMLAWNASLQTKCFQIRQTSHSERPHIKGYSSVSLLFIPIQKNHYLDYTSS